MYDKVHEYLMLLSQIISMMSSLNPTPQVNVHRFYWYGEENEISILLSDPLPKAKDSGIRISTQRNL